MKLLAVFCLLMIFVPASFGKGKAKHGKWFYDYKKTEGSEYEIVFHLNLDEGWYVSAEENNEKRTQPPVFKFDDSDATYSFNGPLSTKGIMETKGIKRRGLMNVYSYNALYIQKVYARPNTKITGSFKYQFFKSSKILRAETEKFEIIVK